ncbi:tetratricopeptide repeat protein [mine drainage metagenome]|uniref:Tetratricopeptide repeat protein n=1 Tax=mine drainage metagenome TaxID=410659 RepID=A0A1J5SHQ0_9ZZZZ
MISVFRVPFSVLGLMAGLLLALPAQAQQSAGPAVPPGGVPSAPAPAAKPAATAGKAGGERIDDARQYAHCIALARQKPEDGWEEALAWTSLGGGEPARHCAAVALFGLKSYAEAATRLEDLAKESRRSNLLRAGMLDQAGQAWLLDHQPEKAYAAITTALQLVPGAPDLLVDRAQALAEARNYQDALKDLNQALAADPNRLDALVFRASAKRILNDLDGAAADITRALALDHLDPDAWLENGMVKRLQGDKDGARKAWMQVLSLAPKSPDADTARQNLELMDVETGK